MRSKLVVLTVVGLVAAALVYWFGLRDRGTPAARPAPAATTPPPAATAKRDAAPPPPAARPKRRPRMAFETDPDGPLRIEGQVLDEDDHPVKGARVRISSSPPRTAETDADGSFTFDKLLGRTYSLTARAGDKIGGPIDTKVATGAEPVVIRLRPGVGLTVNVSDAATKQPIAGASVVLLDGTETTETTDASGKATFRGVGPGWTAVSASAPRYGRVTANKMIGAREQAVTVEVALRTGAPLSGRVVDDQARGLPGAQVWAVDVSNIWEQRGSELGAVTSGPDGAFTLPAMAAGSYVLRAKNESHAPGASTPITVTGETATTGVEIVMKAAAALSGVVVSAEGQPVPYATVKLSSREMSMDMVHRQAAADDRGRFELRALPRAQFRVRAESEDAASRAVDLDLATTPTRTDVKLVLDQTGTIAGIVVDGAGDPVAEAEVNAMPDFLSGEKQGDDFVLAQNAAATTDGGGRFTLRGLEAGKFRVTATRSSGGVTARAASEGVVASTGDKSVRLVLPAPGGVKGKVALESGEPPALAVVSADWEHRVTIREGRFELSDLPPGKYDLRVVGADFADKIARDIVVEAGKVADAGTITVRGGRKISGRVVDGTGQPIAGARVVYGKMLFGDGQATGADSDDDASQFGLRQTSTDPSGGFVITGAPRSGGSIVAEHAERGRSIAQRIPPGTDDVPGVALALKAYGSIAGVVTRAGAPVSGATVSIASSGSSGQASFVTTSQDGSFVIDKVAEGPAGLSAMKTGMMTMQGASRTVNVVAGQRVDGSLDIPVGEVALTVKVTPREGAVVNLGQVFLFRGAVSVSTGDRIIDAFFANQGVEGGTGEMAMRGAAGMLFWMGGEIYPTFKELTPGPYSACVIPVTGSVTDRQLMERIQRNLDKLEVVCKTLTVTAAPLAQSLAVAVPTMNPLPDDD